MALFGKREKIFEVWGDAPRWKAAKRALKDAGIKIMESGFYDTEMPVCGCGAKLDHRDFGPNGKIDRHTYYLSVRPEDAERAFPSFALFLKTVHSAWMGNTTPPTEMLAISSMGMISENTWLLEQTVVPPSGLMLPPELERSITVPSVRVSRISTFSI